MNALLCGAGWHCAARLLHERESPRAIRPICKKAMGWVPFSCKSSALQRPISRFLSTVYEFFTDDYLVVCEEFGTAGVKHIGCGFLRNEAGGQKQARAVIGAKVRADLIIGRTVPGSDVKKWRNSVAIVPIASACCTCVPGLLPLLPRALSSG